MCVCMFLCKFGNISGQPAGHQFGQRTCWEVGGQQPRSRGATSNPLFYISHSRKIVREICVACRVRERTHTHSARVRGPASASRPRLSPRIDGTSRNPLARVPVPICNGVHIKKIHSAPFVRQLVVRRHLNNQAGRTPPARLRTSLSLLSQALFRYNFTTQSI